MSKTYTENQVRLLITNEVAAALSQPTYESRLCDAVKATLSARGVAFTGDIEVDIKLATDAFNISK